MTRRHLITANTVLLSMLAGLALAMVAVTGFHLSVDALSDLADTPHFECVEGPAC